MLLLRYNHKNGNDAACHDRIFRQPNDNHSIVAFQHHEHAAYCFGFRPDYRQNVARDCESLCI